MSADSGDNFFSRWSKRKQDERAGKPLAEPEAASKAVPPPTGQVPAAQPTACEPSPVKLPTLEEAQALTPESDFKPFMAQGVTPDVKNAAMKQLFADPHFNVMDRMDTYIDDYSLPDPLPESMLRKMASAKFLNLFEEDEDDKARAAAAVPSAPSLSPAPEVTREAPNTPAAQVVAQSPLTLELPEKNDDTDLRLQPDHAPPGKDPGRGAE